MRYIEWMSRGRLTGRIAYTLTEEKLPEPQPGAEWQLDHNFNAAEVLLQRPDLKSTIKQAIDNGIAILEGSQVERRPAGPSK
jgi:hypothetical protein